MKTQLLNTIIITQQEIYNSLKVPLPYRNKKKYLRKQKHNKSLKFEAFDTLFGYPKFLT